MLFALPCLRRVCLRLRALMLTRMLTRMDTVLFVKYVCAAGICESILLLSVCVCALHRSGKPRRL